MPWRICARRFPKYENWMKWYAAIVLHSKYYQEAPPSSISRTTFCPRRSISESEVAAVAGIEKLDAAARGRSRLVSRTSAARSSAGRRLLSAEISRLVQLPRQLQRSAFSSKSALGGGANARRSGAEDLAQQQARVAHGTQSFFGEHHVRRRIRLDAALQRTLRTDGRRDSRGHRNEGINDAPYWPTQICWTYKEVWTQPVGEWIWLMQDLHGSAVAEGNADAAPGEPIEFRDQRTGRVTRVAADAAAENLESSCRKDGIAYGRVWCIPR